MNISRVVRLGVRHFATLTRTMLVVAGFRIALVFFKYRQIAQRITVRAPSKIVDKQAAYVAAWSVKQVSRVIPFASCLTQALSVQYLLAKLGFSSVIRVGMRLDTTDAIHAHAWVLFEDLVLIGENGRDLSQYSVLTDLVPLHDG